MSDRQNERRLTHLVLVRDVLRIDAASKLAEAKAAEAVRRRAEERRRVSSGEALTNWIAALSARPIAPHIVEAWARESAKSDRALAEAEASTRAAAEHTEARAGELAFAEAAKRLAAKVLARTKRRNGQRQQERAAASLADRITQASRSS